MAGLLDTIKGYANTASNFLDENLGSDKVTRALMPTGVGLLQNTYDKGQKEVTDAVKEYAPKAAAFAKKGAEQFGKAAVPVMGQVNAEDDTNIRNAVSAASDTVKSELEGKGIPTFETQQAKDFVKDLGEEGVAKFKQAVNDIDGMSITKLPSTIKEKLAVPLATPTPKLSTEEQKETQTLINDTQKDSQHITTALENSDPNTEEGKQLWDQIADNLGVPFDYLKSAWDELDDMAGGVPSGVAGLAGDAVDSAIDGAMWLNSKVDFITMLGAAAAAATNTNSVAVAAAQGLAAGIQSRQNQLAQAVKAKEDRDRWEAEQNVREYNALTSREKNLLGENKPLELSSSDRAQLPNLAKANSVDENAAADIILTLKQNKVAVTPRNFSQAVEQYKSRDKISSNWFFKDKLI